LTILHNSGPGQAPGLQNSAHVRKIVTLGPEHLARLDAVSKVDLGFPHDFLTGVRDIVYGVVYDQIDNHRHV